MSGIMKRKLIVGLVIIGVLISSFLASLSEIKADQEITFPDKNLEEIIREAIGKSSGPIYESDLENITELNTEDRGIISIRGLEHCKNLLELHLSHNDISDISPLGSLTKLQKLYLTSNEINNISPLRNLRNLQELYLSNNKIGYIGDLIYLTNIRVLNLGNNEITVFSPLSYLINLEMLSLDGTKISELSSLSTLKNLRFLSVEYALVKDISHIEGLTNLCGLHLEGNKIEDISAIENLKKIGDCNASPALSLSFNSIKNIFPLVKNSGINRGDEIYIEYNPLNVESVTNYIPTLENRGVIVIWEPVSRPSTIPPQTTSPAPTTPVPTTPSKPSIFIEEFFGVPLWFIIFLCFIFSGVVYHIDEKTGGAVALAIGLITLIIYLANL